MKLIMLFTSIVLLLLLATLKLKMKMILFKLPKGYFS